MIDLNLIFQHAARISILFLYKNRII